MPSKKAKSKQKAKAKKEARKAAVAAENAKRALVSAALLGDDGRPNNVLAAFAPFAKYDRAGLDLTIEFGAPSTIAPDDMDWMLRQTKTNMEELYISGGWGWNDADKRRELTEDDARHLLVRRRSTAGDESKDGSGDATSQGELVAFAHFRFLLEDDAPVLYVQELQLAESVQRKGLGKHLMQTLELIARKNQMQWVMLTVFKANVAAVEFYQKKLKYTIDDSSPDMHYADKEYSYLILSKCIDPVVAKALKQQQAQEAAENAANAATLLGAVALGK